MNLESLYSETFTLLVKIFKDFSSTSSLSEGDKVLEYSIDQSLQAIRNHLPNENGNLTLEIFLKKANQFGFENSFTKMVKNFYDLTNYQNTVLSRSNKEKKQFFQTQFKTGLKEIIEKLKYNI